MVYYLPIYFQNVCQHPPIVSAALLVPLFVAQMTFSVASGLYISKFGRYMEIIWTGFALWTLYVFLFSTIMHLMYTANTGNNSGSGLTIAFDETTSPAVICIVLAIFGMGVGNVFQPTLIALQAHCRQAQRAVIISNRNFLRALGGAVGLGVSSLVMQTALQRSLPLEFRYLTNSAYRLPNFSAFTAEQKTLVVHSYRKAVQMVFIVLTPMVGMCLLGCFMIRDRGLERSEEKESSHPKSGTAESIQLGEAVTTMPPRNPRHEGRRCF